MGSLWHSTVCRPKRGRWWLRAGHPSWLEENPLMSFRSFTSPGRWFRSRSAARRTRPVKRQLQLESLEGRLVPTIYFHPGLDSGETVQNHHSVMANPCNLYLIFTGGADWWGGIENHIVDPNGF